MAFQFEHSSDTFTSFRISLLSYFQVDILKSDRFKLTTAANEMKVVRLFRFKWLISIETILTASTLSKFILNLEIEPPNRILKYTQIVTKSAVAKRWSDERRNKTSQTK